MALLAILAGTVLGAVLGSFAAVLVLRWPRGLGVGGRSRCDGCGAVLRPRDLVPILSWLARRGRCARCGARIDPVHPVMEAGGAAIGAVTMTLLPPPLAIAGIGFGMALLTLAALDIGHFWLPDRIVGPLALAGLAVSVAGLGPVPRDALTGLAAGFAGLWLVGVGYRRLRGRDGLGGGDPKLLGAIGAWTGWTALPAIVTAAALLGLALVLLDALRGRGLRADARVPLGALLAAAAWPVWLWLRAPALAALP